MVPTSPTRELYVQGSQEHQRPGSNPRTGRLKTDALTTGPRESLTHLGVSSAMNPVLRVGLCVVKRVARAGRPQSTCTGSGQGGRGLGGVRHRWIAD